MTKEKIIELIDLLNEWIYYDKDCILEEEKYGDNACGFCKYAALPNSYAFVDCRIYFAKKLILDKTGYSNLWFTDNHFPPFKKNIMTLEKAKKLVDLLYEYIYDKKYCDLECSNCHDYLVYRINNSSTFIPTECPIHLTIDMIKNKTNNLKSYEIRKI